MGKKLKRRKKKLQIRTDFFDRTKEKGGYKKPGSMNGRKT